ncbi:hypothetical protein [Chromatocurvus halotolerans]|uniref:Transglycosylase SLT domain-containing protein n=1 Tax=Chromatocurvus halotolerans TaxID=1132028 RepID=A0A4R2L234_9GAMM|nr:hypothetical protein [Chromatocurvus halotolerans]TCO77806.1 hypothetical protein EV688_102263 [Chromatocurvus halotolerans]
MLTAAPVRCVLFLLTLSVTGCTTAPPRDLDNVCAIFREKKGWYADARDAQKTWGGDIAISMAFMHQESRFVARAKPPRRKILWVIPGPRPSDSYGYSQALGSTWEAYKRSAGRYRANRAHFDDAVDFVGWYNHQSFVRSRIPKTDAYRLYLAYHEGHGGYNRGTYRNKSWLQSVARKVADRAAMYRGQLASCESSLRRRRGLFGWF